MDNFYCVTVLKWVHFTHQYTIAGCVTNSTFENTVSALSNRDLTILGRQRDDDGQNKLLQINGSKDNSSYIINRTNLIQS
jgi:hypothetical protein